MRVKVQSWCSANPWRAAVIAVGAAVGLAFLFGLFIVPAETFTYGMAALGVLVLLWLWGRMNPIASLCVFLVLLAVVWIALAPENAEIGYRLSCVDEANGHSCTVSPIAR